jgi:3-oxoacyl-(acyl-carrier-protein) synthase
LSEHEPRGPGSPRLVITGLGAIGPWGAGRDALASALTGSRTFLEPFGSSGPSERLLGFRSLGLTAGEGAGWTGRADDASYAAWVPARAARRMSRPSRMAVAAARMALAEAGLANAGSAGGDGEPLPPDFEGAEAAREAMAEAAVVLSTAYGPSSVTEELEEQILLRNPEAASPFLFAESVANAPAAQVARLTGARGANLTMTAREAGTLMAVRQAAGELEAGRSAAALAGTVDEITPVLQVILDRFGSLARGRRAGEAPTPRPFDRRRSGFVTGEGATVAVLETPETARRRGREPLAKIAGSAGAFDPTAPRHGWGTGHWMLGRTLRRTLERAGVAPTGIDLIVSGASGSIPGDRLEALTLRAAWEEAPLPPVVAPKAVTGELGGTQLAVAVLALAGAPFGPTPGFRAVDPELGVEPWSDRSGGSFPRPVRRVLVTSLTPSGTAAFLVLEHPAP